MQIQNNAITTSLPAVISFLPHAVSRTCLFTALTSVVLVRDLNINLHMDSCSFALSQCLLKLSEIFLYVFIALIPEVSGVTHKVVAGHCVAGFHSNQGKSLSDGVR